MQGFFYFGLLVIVYSATFDIMKWLLATFTLLFISSLSSAQNDTISLNNVAGFLPLYNEAQPLLYKHSSGGYVYGTNSSAFGMDQCAQGFKNVNSIPVKVTELLAVFGMKNHFSGDSTSHIVIKLHPMKANMAYNDDGSGTNYTVNSPGPTDSVVTSNTLYVHQIDTSGSFQVISLSGQPQFSNDFAISVDFRDAKSRGDTIALMSDTIGSANELDYAFSWAAADSAYWFVTDFLMSIGSGGTGGSNNNIALFPVVDPTVGIQKIANSNQVDILYPNPINQGALIHIQHGTEHRGEQLIVDAAGKIVLRLDRYDTTISTGKLKPGTYFYLNISDYSRYATKFIVE